MKVAEEKASRIIRVRDSTYKKLIKFGQMGEPVDKAVSRCIDLASQKLSNRGKQELASEVTA
jgi:hypothetical protein